MTRCAKDKDRIVTERREMMIFRPAAKGLRTGQEASRSQADESNQINGQLIASPIRSIDPIVLPPCERTTAAVYESVPADGMSFSEGFPSFEWIRTGFL